MTTFVEQDAKVARRMRRLKNRHDWLSARIIIGEDEGFPVKRHVYAERSALRWALEELEEKYGPVQEEV